MLQRIEETDDETFKEFEDFITGIIEKFEHCITFKKLDDVSTK